MKNRFISEINLDPTGHSVNISFKDSPDITWTFHAQWLANSCCTTGFSKSAYNSPFTQDQQTIKSAKILSNGDLLIEWSTYNTVSSFPAIWLNVVANQVAKPNCKIQNTNMINYWYANSVVIPEIEWSSIMDNNGSCIKIREQVIDMLVNNSRYGIVKITNLPPADIESEHKTENTLITRLLKQLFGSVFFHYRRGADKTFNVSTINNSRANGLDNYDVTKVLLPHTDHAHYIHPVMIMGLYALEGVSVNTWLDGFAALEILKTEDWESYQTLCHTPLCFGRIAKYYFPNLFQANTDTAITLFPGNTQLVKRIKWHPHLIGWINSSFHEYPKAITAAQKFQEIIMRPNIKLEIDMQPGDLYLWNNFRILHGRQSVSSTIRTSVGQTVPEEVVMNTVREIKIAQINSLGENWLAQIPTELLNRVIALEAANFS